MGYISSKELAERWNVSTSRVVLLAKNGRIPGARLVGHSWAFPEETRKLEDRRIRDNRRKTKEKPFRFPLYFFNRYSEHEVETEFRADERALYRAEQLYYSGDYSRASDALLAVLDKTEDTAVQVGALYFLCRASILLGRFSEGLGYYGRINLILEEEPDHKRELEFILHDLDSYCRSTEYFTENFEISPEYEYHPSAHNYLFTLSAFSAVMRQLNGKAHVDPAVYELLCRSMEDKASAYSTMWMHLYLAALQYLSNHQESCSMHLRRTLHLALELHSLREIAYMYHYMPACFDLVLEEEELAEASALKEICMELIARTQEMMEFVGINCPLFALGDEDMAYILYAIRGCTNSEAAKQLGVSLSTVSKHYSLLYEQFGVNGKGALAELALQYLNQFQP